MLAQYVLDSRGKNENGLKLIERGKLKHKNSFLHETTEKFPKNLLSYLKPPGNMKHFTSLGNVWVFEKKGSTKLLLKLLKKNTGTVRLR